jgi:uncharacterized NAD(P)/FAD-binding protein YdhS
MMRVDLAIVGGGFSGCAVAANLALSADPQFSLALFEPEALGRGAAYGTRCHEHVLNTRAHMMSLYSDQPDHFVRWLGARGGPMDFVSRQLYGEYVHENAARAFECPRFTRVRDRVAKVTRDDDQGFEVVSDSGARFRARAVVLATGNAPPNDDFLPLEMRLHPGYVPNPWRFDYSVVGGHVLAIGSGLTALDVLVGLKGSGHRGTVHVLSRRGRFPEVHETVGAYDVIPALDTRGARALLRSLRRHVEEAESRGFNWRAVIDALRPEAEALWKRLPAAEQIRFERHLRTHWERRRHRIPPQVEEVRRSYVRAGRLRTYAGRVAGMQNGTVSISLASGESIELRPDWIVNCTGLARFSTLQRDPLLGAMLADGIVTYERNGLGLRAGADLAAIDAQGNRVPNLWIVGPPVRGSRFEATAVPELRAMAEATAGAILRSMHSGGRAQPLKAYP